MSRAVIRPSSAVTTVKPGISDVSIGKGSATTAVDEQSMTTAAKYIRPTGTPGSTDLK
jgi:hypothetical protein